MDNFKSLILSRGIFDYKFDFTKESLWGLAYAGVMAVAQLVITANPSTVQTGHFWIYTASAAAARGIIAIVLGKQS